MSIIKSAALLLSGVSAGVIYMGYNNWSIKDDVAKNYRALKIEHDGLIPLGYIQDLSSGKIYKNASEAAEGLRSDQQEVFEHLSGGKASVNGHILMDIGNDNYDVSMLDKN